MAKDPFAPSSTGDLKLRDFVGEFAKLTGRDNRLDNAPGLAGILEKGLSASG